MTGSWLIVFNPLSRNGRNKVLAAKTARLLSTAGVAHDLVETRSLTHAMDVVGNSRVAGYERVVAIGGDGTAHHVANGAIAAGLPFGLIPAGSGNDFANAIGLNGDLDQAVHTLLNGRREPISVARVTTSQGIHYSINMVDTGIGAQVALRARTNLKWLFGPVRYNLISLSAILRHRDIPALVTLDDRAPLKVELTMLICGFGQTAAAGMRFLPDSRFTHDCMHGAIVFGAGRANTLKALKAVWRGRHTRLVNIVRMFRAKKVVVETLTPSGPLWVESEGEVHGQTRVVIESVPSGLEVFVPEGFDLSEPSLLARSSAA